MCHSAASELDRSQAAPQAARHFVLAQLRHWGVDDADVAWGLCSDAALVASELVTNAGRVSSTRLAVSVEAHYDYVEIAVSDDDDSLPVARRPTSDAEGGRGLTIVSSLASSWGVRSEGEGKTVWCRLAVPGGSVLAGGCRRMGLDANGPCANRSSRAPRSPGAIRSPDGPLGAGP